MATFGKFEPDEAVREGWARDPENEVSFDGYNAFIQITTVDNSSGFSVTNAVGATAFRAKSGGDGYIAQNLGIGTLNPTETLDVIGTAKMLGFHLPTDAVDGYVLTSNATGVGTWQPIDVSNINLSIDDLSDVDTSTNPPEDGYVLTWDGDNWIPEQPSGVSLNDELVKVSVNDTTAGYLNGKLVAGTNISLVENNNGGNETLTINASGGATDELVKVSSNDTTADYLINKLVDAGGINIVEVNDGSNESVELSINDGYHRELDQLVHRISEDSYDEFFYVGLCRIGRIITWTDMSKTTKIRERIMTYNGVKINQVTTIQYNAAGIEVERMVEDYDYNGFKIDTVTRMVTLS